MLKVGKSKSFPRGSSLNYYRSAAVDKSPSPFVRRRAKKGRVRKYFLRSLDIVVIIALLLTIFYSLFVGATPKILLNSQVYHPVAVYQLAANKLFSSLSNRNKITLNEDHVTTSLRKEFPEIASAYIELPILSETPNVHLDIAKPDFVLVTSRSRFIIDSQGVAVAQSSELPQINKLNTLIDESGFKVVTGKQVLSGQSVSFIDNLLIQLNHAKVPVKKIVLPSQVQELDVYTSDRQYFTKFYLGGDLLLQAGQYLAARNDFDQSGQQPSQYLDVRVAGKIFYK